MSAALRDLAEVEAAGRALWADQAAAGAPPLTQAQADYADALVSPHLDRIRAARREPQAA